MPNALCAGIKICVLLEAISRIQVAGMIPGGSVGSGYVEVEVEYHLQQHSSLGGPHSTVY